MRGVVIGKLERQFLLSYFGLMEWLSSNEGNYHEQHSIFMVVLSLVSAQLLPLISTVACVQYSSASHILTLPAIEPKRIHAFKTLPWKRGAADSLSDICYSVDREIFPASGPPLV